MSARYPFESSSKRLKQLLSSSQKEGGGGGGGGGDDDGDESQQQNENEEEGITEKIEEIDYEEKNETQIQPSFRGEGDAPSHTSHSFQNQQQTCLVCFEKEPDSVYLECGHGGICYDCSLELWKNTGNCYLCRKPISYVLQIDLKYKNGDFIKVLSSTEMIIT